jgi:long-chain fatty acid transport protein
MVVYSNPARIGDLGKFNSTIGGNLVLWDAERSGNGTSDTMESQSIFIPSFGVTGSAQDGRWGFGLAVLSPYGLKTEWSDTSSVRYVATKSDLTMVDITPGVSYRPSDKWSVGMGIDYFKVLDVTLERKVLNISGSNPSGDPDANSKMSGDGDQWGYHAGLMFQPFEKHAFGAVYHNEVKMKIEGDIELTGLAADYMGLFQGTSFKTKGSVDLMLPQNVQLGYAFIPSDRWRFEINGAWFDWSANQQLKPVTPNVTNPTQASLLTNPTPLKWKDVWSFGLGSTFAPGGNFKWSGNVFYITAAVPEETFSPAIPDSDRYGFGFGPSYTKNRFVIDAVYNYTIYKDRTVNNNMGQTVAGFAAADISGTYKSNIQIIGLNVGYRY